METQEKAIISKEILGKIEKLQIDALQRRNCPMQATKNPTLDSVFTQEKVKKNTGQQRGRA